MMSALACEMSAAISPAATPATPATDAAPPCIAMVPSPRRWMARLSLTAMLVGGAAFSATLIAVLAGVALWGDFAIDRLFSRQERGEHALTESQRAQVAILQAVREERDFRIDRQRADSAQSTRDFIVTIRDHLAQAQRALQAVRQQASDLELLRVVDALDAAVHDFERNVVELSQLLVRRGLVEGGIEGNLRRSAHEMEAHIGAHDALLVGLLTLRRYEKDFIARGDRQSTAHFGEALQAFDHLVDHAGWPPERKEALRALAQGYARDFNAFVQVTGDIEVGSAVRDRILGTIEVALTRLSTQARELETATGAEIELLMVRMTMWTIGLGILVALSLVAINGLIAGAMTRTLRRTVEFADRVAAGDLSTRLEDAGGKECVNLRAALNRMADALETSRRQLEARVVERTHELADATAQSNGRALELEVRNVQMRGIGELGLLLQRCVTPQEGCEAVREGALRLFPEACGAAYLVSPSTRTLELACEWGAIAAFSPSLALQDCWGLRGGQPHGGSLPGHGLRCRHIGERTDSPLCVPLLSHGETLGLLVLATADARAWPAERVQRASEIAELAALSVANIRLQQSLQEMSMRDPLTGLFNRRCMEETLERELQRARRSGALLSVLMIDIDHFKRVNDSFGHAAGDDVLRAIGASLGDATRESDVACRYGGEEFIVILPGASLQQAVARGEQWRVAISRRPLTSGGASLGTVTVSMGVAAFPLHGDSGKAVLQAADAALYQAKEAGRNRVIAAAAAQDAALAVQ